MTPLRAWAPRNERAYDKRPSHRGTNISMAGAIKESGMQALYPYDGAVNSCKFLDFVETKLLPKMAKGDVIIMDNCSTHHSKAVKARLQKLSLEVLYMPPYSPELNPIEEAWSVVKRKLEQRKARTIPDYVDGLLDACISLDSTKYKGFFKHAAQFGSFC
jgi:transposase